MRFPGLGRVEDVATSQNEIVDVVASGMHPTEECTGEVCVKKVARQIGTKVSVQEWQ
jgi:hypothetical protein